MIKILATDNLPTVQKAIYDIYAIPDDRLYSVWDLLSNQERFTMRALKGIRKDDQAKLRLNLIISLSWFLAILNRFHIDLEKGVWHRFPYVCSYCAQSPCVCKKTHPTKRAKISKTSHTKPTSLHSFQQMFGQIYPAKSRSLEQAGVHLAEELGELSEAIHLFLGEHKATQFQLIVDESADFFSCAVGVANSAGIDIAREFARLFKNNCHVCHKAPCVCKFSFVAKFRS